MKAGHICTCKSFVLGKLECNVNKGTKLLRVNTVLNRSRHFANPPGYVYVIAQTDLPLH